MGTHNGQPANPSPGYATQQLQGNVSNEVNRLKGALDGLDTRHKSSAATNTRETTLIEVLSNADPAQMQLIRDTYKRCYGTSLADDITNRTSSYFQHGLLAIVCGPLGQDVQNVRKAISGLTADQAVLNDVLLSRSDADLKAIKAEYLKIFGSPLEHDVTKRLSGDVKMMFEMVLKAEESVVPAGVQVDANIVELYDAGQGRMGTDERSFCAVITRKSDAQLRNISKAYQKKYMTPLDEIVDEEFSLRLKSALHHIVRGANDRPMRDARLLDDAIAGFGTKHELLIERIVRFHWDHAHMAQVAAAYKQAFNKTLDDRIRGSEESRMPIWT
ncbi:MAG: hypothetical protein M1840_005398 [Geoglossum simile]|nr:MAG: hypothetical protein M1840_005398 [Geoglossum simile]